MRPAYHEDLSLAEELLILAVKDGKSTFEITRIRELYQRVGDEMALRLATDNKLLPVVAHRLMDAFRGRDIPSWWLEVHQKAEEKTNYFLRELDRLALLLAPKGIPIVAIENGGVARDVYPCRGCFASNDMEILVDPNNVLTVDRILKDEGYERRSRERCDSEDPKLWDLEIKGWNNYCKTLAEGTVFWLNVQWQAVLRRWIPMEFGLTAAELIERSFPVSDPSSQVRILAPEDNLILCALHTASHSYVRGPGLRLQLDVDRIIRRISIDWELFLARAYRYKAASLIFPSLAIPKVLFDTPVPDKVLNALVPSVKKRSQILKKIAQASVFNRHLHKFSALQLLALEFQLSDNGWLGGFRRIFIPPSNWMRERYRLRNSPPLFYCYVDRLLELARQRYV